MTTTGERLVTLSELPGVETAMTHFLAIDTSGGGGDPVSVLRLVGEVDVDLEGPLRAALSDEGITAVIRPAVDIVVDADIDVEVEDDGITGETC